MKRMRKFLIAGNWKMNGGPEATAALLDEINRLKPEISEEVDVLVCPPFVSLSMASEYLRDSDIQVGGQNMHFEEKGAYTGEISAGMLIESGCNYVILGHSERRQYFGETDELVNKKTKKALAVKLAPVVCVGESLEERKAEKHFERTETQVKAAFSGTSPADAADVVVAYEPVWAIGTGETASPVQAQEMHAYIRGVISALYDEDTAARVRILYGGSMKPGNAGELLEQPDVDGGLIGGASLKAEDFIQIINTAEKLS